MTALLLPAFKVRPVEAEDRVFQHPVGVSEIREAGGGWELRGVAIRYDTPSPAGKLDFTESFRPGAFTNLDDPDIFLCAHHRPDKLLGRVGSGTLSLEDSPRELRYRCQVPDTGDGRDVVALARRGDLPGASISFIADVRGQEWSGTPQNRRRVISRARLLHLSPVAAPAHDTSLEVSVG